MITVQTVYSDYQISRRLKPTTRDCYRKAISRCLGDWLDMPVTAITKDMIEERHRALSEIGPAQANLTMRILRALMSFAMFKYEDRDGNAIIKRNPVLRLTETRCWNSNKRRQSFISKSSMPVWWQALLSLQNIDARDYVAFLMLTGLRRSEAATLQWSDIDFANCWFTVSDTKNGDPHTLPMSDVIEALLRSRAGQHPRYVFTGGTAAGHISRWSRMYSAMLDGVPFKLHDLRRTFITVADDLEIRDSTIKRLVNHRTNDVTDGYKVKNPERLRRPMQAITDEILRQADMERVSLPWLSTDSPSGVVP